MASRIGGISIGLTASTGQFMAGMRSAGGALRGFSGIAAVATANVKGMGMIATTVATGIGTAVGTFIGGMAIRAFSSFISIVLRAKMSLMQFFEEHRHILDRLGKFSRELGFTIQSLQAFRLAASLAGTPVIDLEKGLQIMTRRIGEARLGTGEARKAFDALGLSVDHLVELGAEGSFLAIADKISRVEDKTQQAALSFMIFSRQGVNLLNFIKEANTSLQPLNDLLESFGGRFAAEGVFSVRAVEVMNDEIEKLKTSFDVLKQSLIIQLAPAITLIITRMLEFMAALGEGKEGGLGQHILERLRQGVISVSEWLVIAGSSAAQFVAGMLSGLSFISLGFSEMISQVESDFVNFQSNFLRFAQWWLGMFTQMPLNMATYLMQGLDMLAKFLDAVGIGSEALVVRINAAKLAIQEIRGTIENLGSSGVLVENSLEKGFDKLSDTLREKAADVTKFGLRIKGMSGDAEKYIDTFSKMATEKMESLLPTPQSRDPFEPIRESAEETKNFIADTFKAGELGLMVTNSMATDLSFLEGKEKGQISSIRDILDEGTKEAPMEETTSPDLEYDDASYGDASLAKDTMSNATIATETMFSGIGAAMANMFRTPEEAEAIQKQQLTVLEGIHAALRGGIPATVG